MGLDIYLLDGKQVVSEKSSKHPDHFFEKGYLRSSYNNAGFCNVVGNLIGKELHYIFAPLEDEEIAEDEFAPPIYPKEHLEEALLRAKEVRAELEHALPFKIESVGLLSIFDKVPFERLRALVPSEALLLFQKVWKKEHVANEPDIFHYFNEAELPVHALIKGIGEHGELALHCVSKAWETPFVYSVPCSTPAGVEAPRTVSHEGALSVFQDHEQDNPHKNYTSFDGAFYFNHPLQVQGIVAGCDYLGKPAVHLIYQIPKENLDAYKKQADIVIEFIEKALTLKQPRIVWSS